MIPLWKALNPICWKNLCFMSPVHFKACYGFRGNPCFNRTSVLRGLTEFSPSVHKAKTTMETECLPYNGKVPITSETHKMFIYQENACILSLRRVKSISPLTSHHLQPLILLLMFNACKSKWMCPWMTHELWAHPQKGQSISIIILTIFALTYGW